MSSRTSGKTIAPMCLTHSLSGDMGQGAALPGQAALLFGREWR